jgi:hypothetical protein
MQKTVNAVTKRSAQRATENTLAKQKVTDVKSRHSKGREEPKRQGPTGTAFPGVRQEDAGQDGEREVWR